MKIGTICVHSALEPDPETGKVQGNPRRVNTNIVEQ
jgi:hypothetical protein